MYIVHCFSTKNNEPGLVALKVRTAHKMIFTIFIFTPTSTHNRDLLRAIVLHHLYTTKKCDREIGYNIPRWAQYIYLCIQCVMSLSGGFLDKHT